MARRVHSSLAKRVDYSHLKGSLFTPFMKRQKLNFNHPLDTDIDEYYNVFHDVIIPQSMKLGPTHQNFQERLKNLLTYNVPAFTECWNFGVELTYKNLVPKKEWTNDSLLKMRILRICMDIAFSQSAVVDDITDGGTERRNKPTWHTFCEGGVNAAIYDAHLLALLPMHLISKFFAQSPVCDRLLDAMIRCTSQMIVGQTVDVLNHGHNNLDLKTYEVIGSYKAGHFFSVQPTLAMLHAGFTNPQEIKQMENIFCKMGTLVQIWDDFSEYYCTEEQTGKPKGDFKNAGSSWVSAYAMKTFSEHQKKIFQENYGSQEFEKVQRVKDLYDEIDTPSHYVNYMKTSAREIQSHIEKLNNSALQRASYSYLNWLLNGVTKIDDKLLRMPQDW